MSWGLAALWLVSEEGPLRFVLTLPPNLRSTLPIWGAQGSQSHPVKDLPPPQ